MGESTRKRIIAEAPRLFGERDVEAVHSAARWRSSSDFVDDGGARAAARGGAAR